MGGAFVLTWPMGAEVNPPELAGSAVAVTNLGGFVGAALTQGPVGAVLDARWTGALVEGARVYPVASYRGAFAICVLFVLLGAAISLLLKETRGENIHHRLRPARPSREPRPVGLGGNPERVGDERDQVVEAGQRDQLDELRLGPVRPQRGPERVVHPGPVVEGVHQADEQALALRERAGPGLGRAGGRHLGAR